jgi:prenyltransferase beta subunit
MTSVIVCHVLSLVVMQRFSYCALNACSLLGKLDRVDVKKATDYGIITTVVLRCQSIITRYEPVGWLVG